VRQFGKLAKESTTLVVPGELSDLASVVSMATSIIRKPPSSATPNPPARPGETRS
jgi:C-terminal region of band_7